MKFLLRLAPLAIICALAASCSTLAVAAATVNGERISEREVEKQLVLLNKDPAFGDALRQDPNVARGDGRRQILTTLIYTMVAEQEANRRHITPTSAQINNLISQRAQSDGLSVNQFLKAQSITLAQARQIAHRLVLDFALQQRVLKNTGVTAADVKRAYDANKQVFAQAHLLRMTLASSNDVRDALEKLNSGQDFATLAKEKSKDQLAPSGGDLGFVLLSRLSPQEQDAVTRAKTGGVSDPVPTQTAFEIFKVVERRTEPLADAEAEIRSGLAQQMRTQDYQNWLQSRVRASRVVVNPQYGRFDRAQAQVVRAPTNLRP